VFSECRKCYFRDPYLKHFLGYMPPNPLANSGLRHSAHTFGEGGGQGKLALWQFCPATEESLKNALYFGDPTTKLKSKKNVLPNLKYQLKNKYPPLAKNVTKRYHSVVTNVLPLL
jgi:hypothetical protein